MTDDYKKNLLNYMIGKIPNESGIDIVSIPTIKEINNNLDSFVREYYSDLSPFWNPSQLITRGDYIILWCNDYDNDIESENYGRWKKSFVLVLDKNYKPFKYIDKYDSGTPLGPLSLVIANDSGEGNIYGIDTVFKDNLKDIDRTRIVIINDFTLTNFGIKLLNSYNIPKYNNHLINISEVIKSETEGKYFLIYRYTESQLVYKGGGLEFVNNVGSENEWNFYPYTGNKNVTWRGYEKGFPVWGDDGLEFKIFAEYETSNYNGNSIAVIVLKSQLDGENKGCIDDISTNLPNACKNVGQIASTVSNNNSVLFTTYTSLSTLSNTKYVIEYKLSDLSYKIWYSKEDYIWENYDDGYLSSHDDITPFIINNQFYFLRIYSYYKATRDNDYNYTYEYYDNDLYLNQIYNDKLTEFFIKDFGQQIDVNFKLSISNVFNLYNFGLVFKNIILNLTQIYNISNYNGNPFINSNSLNSNSTILYSNQSPVFARNLYNKTQNGSTTTSTIEIPNNYLNEIMIDKKELLSENNNVIVSDLNGFTKNIYETVYLNFVNTISIIDRNNATQVLNQEASTYLNSSINTDDSYDNAKFYHKAIMYYQDSSTREISYEFQNKEDKSVEIVFGLFVDKLIDRVEFVSNDKSTIYQSINLTSLEENKFYTINQKLKII